jgi:hypothetical protein
MHPILKSALEPLAEQIAGLSLQEAQVHPLPGQGRWSPQQIVEHLILTYEQTADSVARQLKSGRVPKNRRGWLEFVIRLQALGFGYMPSGVPATLATRPSEYEAQAGEAIAARFMEAAESMDVQLVAARKKFGIQGCGEHAFYGVMRVDEWRRYHSLHARHHAAQLKAAIRYARAHPDGE